MTSLIDVSYVAFIDYCHISIHFGVRLCCKFDHTQVLDGHIYLRVSDKTDL